jgi:type II secretory pathway component GspD/PulD (secretin)
MARQWLYVRTAMLPCALCALVTMLHPGVSSADDQPVMTSDQSASSESATKSQAVMVQSGEQPPGGQPKPGERPGKPEGPPGKPGGPPGKPGEQPGKPGEQPKQEGPKPITRPDKPSKPPDPEELKIKPDADGKVRFNFNGQPWLPVMEWLAKNSNMSLDWQELPGDYLNLSTQRRYTISEARDLINKYLLARGYTLLCQGEVLTVANVKKLDASLVPRVAPEDLDKRDPYEFVKVSFTLDWLMADALIEELKPMKSPNGTLTPLKSLNRLEAIDAVINLREMRALLSEEQSANNQERLISVFELHHARASDVCDQIKTLLGLEKSGTPGTPGGQQGMDPAQQQAMMRMQQEQQRQQQQGGQPGAQPGAPKPKQPVTLVVNQRQNSIIAHAPADTMAVIDQAVKALDVPAETSQSLLTNINRMQTYRITGVEPEPVVKTLLELGNLDPTTRLEIDKKNKVIIAYASLADHVTIAALVKRLSGSDRHSAVIRLRKLSADYVAGSVTFMMVGDKKKETPRRSYWMMDYGSQSSAEQKSDEFRVEADIEYNRLLLWANDVELAEVENLLVKLGEIAPNGSNRETYRVIQARDEKEADELLEQIRRAWPSVAPNPLQEGPAPKSKKPKAEPSEEKLSPPESETKSVDLAVPKADNLKFVQFNREDAPQMTSKESPARTPPPVQVTKDADGRISISSDDTEALDAFEELAAGFSPTRKTYQVFKLKYTEAYGVCSILEEYFKDDDKKQTRMTWMDYYYGSDSNDNKDDKSGRLSKRRKLKFISDTQTNSILVENADANQLKTIKELIAVYDSPEPKDSQSVRKTDIFNLKHSKAKLVAETIKEVFRDLLSANDKALQGAKNDRDSSRTIVYDWFGGGDGKEETKMPKFKGQLSIGVDEVSNSLIISAPAYLFDHVSKLVNELDQAAAPTSTVKVIGLAPHISGQKTQEILSNVLGQGGSSKQKSESQSSAGSKSNNKQSKNKNNGASGNSKSN